MTWSLKQHGTFNELFSYIYLLRELTFCFTANPSNRVKRLPFPENLKKEPCSSNKKFEHISTRDLTFEIHL